MAAEEKRPKFSIPLRNPFQLFKKDTKYLSRRSPLQKYGLEQSFTDHSHTGNVKTVAISKKGVLASGSSDETIKLFNLVSRKEIGTLMHHKGSITSLEFFGKKHLFSSSEDGTIGVWQVGRWECLRTLKGHKGTVNHISVHPSGKLALSVSRDKTLRTWNLLTAKCAYVSNIKAEADIVTWSPSGEYYLLGINNKVDIYKVETSSIIHTITLSARIHNIKFMKEDILVVAGEGGEVFLYNVKTADKLHEFSTETNRIKGLEILEEDGDVYWIVTGSSEGFVKVWKFNIKTMVNKLVASQNTKFRITSLAATKLSSAAEEMVAAEAADDEVAAEDGEAEAEDDDDEQEQEKQKNVEVKKKPMKKSQLKEKPKKRHVQLLEESESTPSKKVKSQKLKEKIKKKKKSI